MPAYHERVIVCPNENGQPAWFLDFPIWWDRSDFFRQYSHRLIDTHNPFFVDYGLLLSASEATQWHQRGKESFSKDSRSQQPYFLESIARWDELLPSARWVIVELEEWESGLG